MGHSRDQSSVGMGRGYSINNRKRCGFIQKNKGRPGRRADPLASISCVNARDGIITEGRGTSSPVSNCPSTSGWDCTTRHRRGMCVILYSGEDSRTLHNGNKNPSIASRYCFQSCYYYPSRLSNPPPTPPLQHLYTSIAIELKG